MEVEVRTLIYRNAQVVWTGPRLPLAASEGDRRQGLNMIGKPDFGRNMVPGEFVLQVLVTDKVADGEKPRTASQWAGFTVR